VVLVDPKIDFEGETLGDELSSAESIDEIEEQETSVEKRCREQWLKWRATLPAPVQEASRQVKSLNDQDPLMLRAIQHGVRDPDYLARLAFYSLGQFGYCPPKGRGLESWRQYRLRATALLKVPVPTAPDIGPRACVGRGENKRDAARPDAPALDVTGRYYFWQDRKPFATVLINQGGRRLDDFSNSNFKQSVGQPVNVGEGQSNQARKQALRRKYAPMNVDALRRAAGENMRRAQCMP
jgi:hypothetical protein